MIIGLTGGIASGKSMVSRYFEEKGYPIVDADVVSRQVVEIGHVGLDRIVKRFGNAILLKDGNLNRKALRDIIFTDEEARLDLNGILHPIIHDEILIQLKKYENEGFEIILFDAPLLLENKLQDMVNQVWVVSTSEDIQIHRLMMRDGITEEEAKAIIKRQMPLNEKEELADVVLYNNGDIRNLYTQVDDALKAIN